jgi:SulP family sulfate permease
MARRVPTPAWTVGYQRGWLRGDVLAGVTITAYLIPQVMAYAEVAGLPAVVGLWASVGALLAYALLGSSRQLSVGPESTTALIPPPPSEHWPRPRRTTTRI